jgi:O-acetylserine/cysteine efflux transporter
MSALHILLALLVVTIWGVNFIFIKLALLDISPLVLCFFRFALACIPAIFFIKPPRGAFKIIFLYGMLTFALQFLFLFLGMRAGMTAGMASLLLQVQVFFSIFFAVIFLGEKFKIYQLFGAIISFVGIGIVAFHVDANMSLLSFIFILAAAAAWGAGNTVTKKVHNINMLSLVVWGSFVACIPMLVTTLIFERAQLFYHLQHLNWSTTLSVFYIAYISTWVGYGIWNRLLNRYAVVIVVPFTLLVPIVGMGGSILFLNESCELWKIIAAVLLISGVCVSLFSARFIKSQSHNLQVRVQEP